jgi:DNA-sulfur modification-associated
MNPPILPTRNTEEDTRDYNLPIYGQRGEYSLSATVKVPYFMALMDLKRVTTQLKTHEEVSPSLETNYNLVELFQRNIDPDRVQKEIVDGFLKNPNKLKFFNSLTIVLLPKDANGRIVRDFEDYSNNNPKIPYQHGDQFDEFFANPDWDHQLFGGVQFVSTHSASLSRLRWDAKRVDAVAVDGQHRLKALKLWMAEKNNELVDVEKATRIPIIFLLLHKNAGFKAAPGSYSSGIKAIAREIFSDLNKNAREVDMATQIILDDRSVASCCVRSLITESTCIDDGLRLPLSLLRWQEANNRFDQKYFLNSLVNLHLIVEDLIDLDPPVKDPMSKTKALEFIRKAKEQLGSGPNKRIENQGIDILEYYEKEFLGEDGDPTAPLTGIPPQFLPAAVNGFKEHFSGWMLRILRDFKPYKDLLEYSAGNELVKGVFSQFLAQPESQRKHLEKELQSQYGEQWRNEILDRHIEAIEKIKGIKDPLGEQWAFKTIFQKSLMRLGKKLFFDAPHEDRERLGSIDDFLSFVDRIHASDLLRVKAPLDDESFKLWTFVALNYGSEKIKVASTSERRIQAVLTLWYYGYRYALNSGKVLSLNRNDELYISTTEILNKFGTKGSQAMWPLVYDHHEELVSEFKKHAHLICGSPESEITPEKQKKVAKQRMSALFNAGLRAWIPEPNGEVAAQTEVTDVEPI